MEPKDQDTKAGGESQPGQSGGFNPMGMMKKMMEKMMSGMMTPEDMPHMMETMMDNVFKEMRTEDRM